MQREMTGCPFFLFGNWKQEAVLGRELESRVFVSAERTELGLVRVKMTMWWRHSLNNQSYSPVRVRHNITKRLLIDFVVPFSW